LASEAVEIASGHWHPPKSSEAQAARLLAEGSRISVRRDEDGAELAAAELQAVAISDRIGRVPRRIAFPDGSLFETPDNDAVDLLLKAHRADRTGWIHDLERFHPRLAVFALIVFLLAGLVYRYALPALVEVAVLVTPPVVGDMMASGTLSTLDRTMFSPSTLASDQQKAIRDGFAGIAAHSSRGADRYHLEFRDGGYIGPNAFALPDGTLVITDQLVALAAGDTELLLGVLAHEIGHVEKNHSLRQVYRAAGTAGLIMLIAGDVGSAGEEVLTDGAALLRDRKSTRLNSSHNSESRMPSSA
jgi:Zn-dependent protease with chaperone function